MAQTKKDMIELADLYGVHQISSLELLKLMLDQKHIGHKTVERVVEQWQFEKDVPYSDWQKEYQSLFGRQPPSA